MAYPNTFAAQAGPIPLSQLDANFNFAVDIQSQALYAAAGGSADAITATYSPAVTALVAGVTLYLRAASANATTTPTFSPNGLTAKTIVKINNQALVAGDIAGAGHILILQYDATNGVWELANPAVSSSSTTATTATNLAGGTVGAVPYQSAAGATTFLADVATGNALISGGVATAPSYGKIGLTTHVSGTLGAANGGTGVANNAASTITVSGNFASTFTVAGAYNYTFPAASDTLVNLGSTQTLTAKTFTNPTVTNYVETVVAIGNSGTSQTLALTNGTVQTVTMTGNCTFTMPTATAGKSFILIVSTGAGGFTGTFTSVKWPSNTAPTLTTTATRWDILTFFADGTNWYGTFAQAFQ